MFAAIRGGLGNSMYRMRPRRMLGLFLFEFFVVVLGVLAAQVVQESVKEHDRQRHTEQELERLSQAYVGTRQVLLGARRFRACAHESNFSCAPRRPTRRSVRRPSNARA